MYDQHFHFGDKIIKTAVHVTVKKFALNYEEEINEFLLFTKKMWRKEVFFCFYS